MTAQKHKTNNEKVPLFVIDGQNVAMEYSGNTIPASGLGIYLVVKYFQELGYRVLVYVPPLYLDERLDDHPTEIKLLKELNRDGLLRTTPATDKDDDKYFLFYAQKVGAYLITKDRFEPQIKALPKDEKAEFRKWRDDFVISNYSYGIDEFFLDPEYKLPSIPPQVGISPEEDCDPPLQEEAGPVVSEVTDSKDKATEAAKIALRKGISSWLGNESHNWTQFGTSLPAIAKKSLGRDFSDRKEIMEYIGIPKTKALRNQMIELMGDDIEIEMKGAHPQNIWMKKQVGNPRTAFSEALMNKLKAGPCLLIKLGLEFCELATKALGKPIKDRKQLMTLIGIPPGKPLYVQLELLLGDQIDIKKVKGKPLSVQLKSKHTPKKKEPEIEVEEAEPPQEPLSLDEFKTKLIKREFDNTNRYHRELPIIIKKTFPFFQKVEYPINKALLGNLFKKIYGKKINDIFGNSDNLSYFISVFGLAHTELINKGDVFRLKGYLEWREMDQEELLGIMDQATDEELHGIMHRLANIGDDDAVEPLIEYIEELVKQEEKHYGRPFDAMLELLGSLGSPKAIPYLLEQLKLPDRDVHQSVIHALGEIGHEDAKETLLKLLKEPDYPHYSIIRSLGIIGGEDIIEHIHPFLDSDDRMTFHYTLDALKKVSSKESFEPLWAQYMKRIEDSITSQKLFKLLIKLDPTEAEHRSYRLLDSKTNGIRKKVARNYADVAAKRDLDSLLKLLEDPDQEFRYWIGAAIMNHLSQHGGEERLIQTIVPLLDSDIEFVRKEAISIIMYQLNEDSLPIIQPFIDDPSKLVRRAIAHNACFRLKPEDSIPILVNMIQDADPNVRSNALYGLHHYYFDDVAMGFAKDNSIPIPKNLIKFTSSEEKREQDEAILALGHLWAEDSLEILLGMKDDPKPKIRMLVAQAFGRIANNECWGHLVDMMDDEDDGVRSAVRGAFYHLKLEEL